MQTFAIIGRAIAVDFVIAGAGHNSLITACYLAKAGFSCTVIDARNVPGGGCATEEVFGAGYKIDTCSTGHTLILQNPIISQDELGLVNEFGLSYLHPDSCPCCFSRWRTDNHDA